MEAVSIYPELVVHRTNSQGLAPVIIRFNVGRRHIATDNTGQKVKPDYWDNKSKKVKERFPNSEFINAIIDNTINRHKNFILKRQAFDLPVTPEIIKQYIKSKCAFDNLHDYAEKVIDTKKLKDGQGYSEDTKRRYRDEIKRLMQFSPSLQFSDLTVQFLEKYKDWMQNAYKKKDGKKMNKNSIWKALGFVRMIYNESVKDEIVLPEGNPFRQFKVGSYEQDTSKVKFLHITQLNAIENLLLTDKFLQPITIAVGWRFLSMCVTGLRISDAMQLNDYHFNELGNLQFKPHKTRRHNNTANIPITTDRQKRYLQTTLQQPLPEINAKSFRTTFNIHLKIIAAKAGIHINLTSHVGRHTMGGFIIDAGIETRPAMAMFGVKSKKTIETYLHLKNEKLQSEAEKMKNIF